MPDRVIRDEILESRRFLALPSDTDRLAFVALLLRADALGNYSAEMWRLWRLWRDFAIPNEEVAAKILEHLVDAGLVQLYTVPDDPKRYLHIPRFGQRLRYVKRVFPPSPWTTNEQKQLLMENSPGERQARTGSAPLEVKGSEVEVKGSEVKKGSSTTANSARAMPQVNPGFIENKSTPKPMTRDDQIAYVAARTKK